MVAKKSSERLPAGWTVQYKVQKAGRKVKIYTNLETGKEFFSKEDLLNYIEAGGDHSSEPQSTNSHITKHAERTPSQPVSDEDKLPKWLPKGWKVEVKTRQSGSLAGKEYKCYIDPLNKCKYYSKPEVLRYLKTAGGRKTSRQGEAKTVKDNSCVFEDAKTVEDNSCVFEDAKTVKDDSCVTKYAETVKDNVCVSKKAKAVKDNSCSSKDVKPVKGNSCISEKKAGTSMYSADKVVEKCEAEDLPPGWTKELRPRKNSKVIKHDPYYTDPVKGYVFRSKKAAWHYIKTGEVGRQVIKPKDSEESMKDETTSSSAAKRQKIDHPASRQELFAGKMGSEKSNIEMPKTRGSKISSAKRVSPEAKVTISARDETIQEKHLIDNTTQEFVETKEKSDLKKSSMLKVERSKRRGDKNSPLSNAGASKRTRGANDTAKDSPVSTPAPDILKEKTFLKTVEKSNVREAQVTSRNSKDTKVHNLPPRSSKRLAGAEPDKVLNLELGERALKTEIIKSRKTEVIQDAGLTLDVLADGSPAKLVTSLETKFVDRASSISNDSLLRDSSKKSSESLKDQVAPEKLHVNLETDHLNDSSEPQLSLLFGSDPCLDFAFKTLLGELPLDDSPLEGPILTPEDDSPLGWPILTPEDDSVQHISLESVIEKSSTERVRTSRNKPKNKKEPKLPHRSSKRLAGAEPEFVAKSVAIERAPQSASRKRKDKSTSSSTNVLPEANQLLGAEPETNQLLGSEPETIQPVGDEPEANQPVGAEPETNQLVAEPETNQLVGAEPEINQLVGAEPETNKLGVEPRAEPKTNQLLGTEPETNKLGSEPEANQLLGAEPKTNQLLGAEPETNLQTQLPNTDTSMQAEPINKTLNTFKDSEAPQEQQQMHETQKAEPETFSFVDYWSDPCLDFAFKTLTGVIPIEESFAQGDFRAQVDISQNQRNGGSTLPDFGSPSLFQTDISSQFDTPEKSMLGPPSSASTPTFLPAGNVNFPSCSGIHSQQQCLEGNNSNNDLHQKQVMDTLSRKTQIMDTQTQ
ncbi:methyl-CpG-binding domain-containing protein 13-like [Humulus lupulus]|uniref:methyl-CpG-binding domain-containing protein 13-like n=1 Tax=Humulus lupulus TaxID=3486 RepID=UPI002B4171BA|nr:methyl-CpG-binding domain-containing protein 13-like [Humulus lupulus]